MLVAVGLAVVAGCADEEAPDWLADLAPTTTTTSASTTATASDAATTTTTADPATPVTALTAGDCVVGDAFRGGDATEAVEAEVVDCATEHDAEVVGLVTYEQGADAPYPGQEEVATLAEDRCATTFEEYVGTPFTDSALELLTLWPTEDSWGNGDREAVCLAFSDTGPLTATVAGTAQ
ncbi:MAG TPA: septum formation family protein [Acidimicrobiales bacterium]|nr:septum formation family protein [Acidimicrobiales bacterium]